MDCVSELDAAVTGYRQIASEYYDPTAHPTCKNFRDASCLFLTKNLPEMQLIRTAVDVGAGSSLLAEVLSTKSITLSRLVILDRCLEMLQHSRAYLATGALLLIADAKALPIDSSAADLVVASLGDAFNVDSFWAEVARCLRRGGRCLFTTPSLEWAQAFRTLATNEKDDFAFFELRDGRGIYVPSIIHPIPVQLPIFLRHNLKPISVELIYKAQLPSPISPNLQFDKTQEQPVVVEDPTDASRKYRAACTSRLLDCLPENLFWPTDLYR